MSAFADAFEPLSVFADIQKYRVSAGPAAPGLPTWKILNNKKLSSLAGKVAGYEKYCDLAGGEDKFRMLAKEGNDYKWLEAFAAVEAVRIGALPGLTFMPERPTDVGYGDAYDNRKRPFDVKTYSPFGGFKIDEVLEDRLFDKGGYIGLDSKTYPAVLILDLAFAPNIQSFNADLKKIFSKSDKPGRKGHSWRVIEVCVDYQNVGDATYTITGREEPGST
jgi:hypothetical protein